MSESLELITPDSAAWDAFVGECEDATAFHTSAWASVWTAEWPGAKWRAIAWQKDGRIFAGLPFLERPTALGRQILSMPDGTYGGPILARWLSLTADAAANIRGRVLEQYRDVARRAGVLHSQLTWFEPTAWFTPWSGNDPPAGLDAEQRFTQVVRLDQGFDTLLARLSHGVRSRVRQSEEAGLLLRPATDVRGVDAYHELVVRNARRHGTGARPLSLYHNVLERMVPRGLARFDLVQHGARTIGGSLHFLANRRALNWLTVADDEHRELRPNHFVISRWLRELSQAGYREYDLGSSPPDARGLIEFKESWGAERRPVLTLRRRSLLHRLLRP